MKNTRRILVLILALVMVMGLALSVSAELTPNPGSITINNAVKGTYKLYKIFDLTYSGNNVAYTIAPAWEAFFNGNGAEYLSDDGDEGLNAITVKTDDGYADKYINITEDNIEAFVDAAEAYALPLTPDYTRQVNENSATIDNLTLGYYLVLPDIDGYVEPISGATICSLTSTTPDANINVKATTPSIFKSADVTGAVQVGDVIEYTITGVVPDVTNISGSYDYVITDTMSGGLTLLRSITITLGEGEDKYSQTVTPWSEYSGRIAVDFDLKNEKAYTFQLTFDTSAYQRYAGQEFTVTYSAFVNENAICGVQENSATLTYTNKAGQEVTTNPQSSSVCTLKLEIRKIDGNTQEGLEGAKFVLRNNDGKYYHMINSVDDNIGTVVDESVPGKIEWVDIGDLTPEEAAAQGLIDEVVSSAVGDFLGYFGGLQEGKYYLVETVAPAGYNKLSEPVEVILTLSDGEENDISVFQQHVTIENFAGSELPSTGGMGTTLLYVLGAILVLGACVLLITKRRVAAK